MTDTPFSIYDQDDNEHVFKNIEDMLPLLLDKNFSNKEQIEILYRKIERIICDLKEGNVNFKNSFQVNLFITNTYSFHTEADKKSIISFLKSVMSVIAKRDLLDQLNEYEPKLAIDTDHLFSRKDKIDKIIKSINNIFEELLVRCEERQTNSQVAIYNNLIMQKPSFQIESKNAAKEIFDDIRNYSPYSQDKFRTGG